MDLASLFSGGLRHHIEGRLDSAKNIYEEVLKRDPQHADALHHLGLIYLQAGVIFQAIAAIQSSLVSDPKNSSALANLGYCFNLIGDHPGAIASCKAALEMDPCNDGAWTNLGNAQRGLKSFVEAMCSYEKALTLCPENPRNEYNVGLALFDQEEFNRAKECFQRCLESDPSIPEAHNSLAACLLKLCEPLLALRHAEAAAGSKPDYAEAWNNRGNALSDLRRHEEALASYERSIKLNPDADYSLGNLVYAQMKICDWSGLDGRCQTLQTQLLTGDLASSPFLILGLFDDPYLQRQCAELHAKRKLGFESEIEPITKTSKRDLKNKIRIGYFSMDFREHPVSYLIAELFELHDRSKFEIYGFSFGINTQDACRRRIEKAFDKFLDVSHLSDLDIVHLSRQHEIEIAIDLGGHTQGARPHIFSARAAPIQINYLGYPGTWGSDCMDYLIADPELIPADSQSAYSEKIIYLPNSYQVNDSQRVISDRAFHRQELGLPQSGFVFCCFNNNWKILPETFDMWARIIQSVPNSVLWLYKDEPTAARNLQARAKRQSVDPNRIVFAERMPNAEHLARYRLADLFLNTFPYGAHTTASDALWAGVPVLTRSGNSFVSRVTGSLLYSVGLPELITHTTEEYKSLAIELAENPEKVSSLKARLALNRPTCPLFNTTLFTQHIEAAYQAVYDRRHIGLAPDHIYVDS
jgi:protein O-GlcNAc transferase